MLLLYMVLNPMSNVHFTAEKEKKVAEKKKKLQQLLRKSEPNPTHTKFEKEANTTKSNPTHEVYRARCRA